MHGSINLCFTPRYKHTCRGNCRRSLSTSPTAASLISLPSNWFVIRNTYLVMIGNMKATDSTFSLWSTTCLWPSPISVSLRIVSSTSRWYFTQTNLFVTGYIDCVCGMILADVSIGHFNLPLCCSVEDIISSSLLMRGSSHIYGLHFVAWVAWLFSNWSVGTLLASLKSVESAKIYIHRAWIEQRMERLTFTYTDDVSHPTCTYPSPPLRTVLVSASSWKLMHHNV